MERIGHRVDQQRAFESRERTRRIVTGEQSGGGALRLRRNVPGRLAERFGQHRRQERPVDRRFPNGGAYRRIDFTQSFAQFGSDLDADTKARLAQGERIVEVLKQNRSAPVAVEKQVAILYATIHDYLVNIKVPAVAEYEKGLYEYLDTDAAGASVMETIRTTGKLEKDAEEALKGVLSAYTENFIKAH